MAKKKKLTPTQRAYQKERNRIKRFIRSAEKRGYEFSTDALPNIPKRITEASVRRLKKLTSKALYEKAVYVSPETGEIVSGLRGRSLEREAVAAKSAVTRKRRRQQEPDFDSITISSFLLSLNAFENGRGAVLLKAWLNELVAEYGKHDVAVMLQKGYENDMILTWETAYNADLAIKFIGDMVKYLPEAGPQTTEMWTDNIDFLTQLAEALEDYESWSYPT